MMDSNVCALPPRVFCFPKFLFKVSFCLENALLSIQLTLYPLAEPGVTTSMKPSLQPKLSWLFLSMPTILSPPCIELCLVGLCTNTCLETVSPLKVIVLPHTLTLVLDPQDPVEFFGSARIVEYWIHLYEALVRAQDGERDAQRWWDPAPASGSMLSGGRWQR